MATPKRNLYEWNRTLKFSWGHIIAFVALIFLSYIAFMGDFYAQGGDFTKSAVKVLIIDVLLLSTFIGAQIVKGADEKFDRMINIERLLIAVSIPVFLFAMIPFNHFWRVFDSRDQIEKQFSGSISGITKMFADYDQYAETRINAFATRLEGAKEGSLANSMHRENYVRTLRLQLCSPAKDSLQHVATQWLDEADRGASVWNAFLVGNIEQINDAISTWHSALREYSKPVLSIEAPADRQVYPFDESGRSIQSATSGLTALTQIYQQEGGFSLTTLWTGAVLFLMLIFPYLLQSRNTRAQGFYHLLPGRKTRKASSTSFSDSSTSSTWQTDSFASDDSTADSASTSSNRPSSTGSGSGGDMFSGSF